jgi:chemotaxis protein histidine kinase CheA
MSSLSSMESFNASISVTELLTKTLENVAKELASRCIEECGRRHGFDAVEEIRALGLENLSLIKKQMTKKSGSKKEAKAEKAPKAKKLSFPLPFIASEVSESGCQGLSYNRGLFTQCTKNRMENGVFCNHCQEEADKNASGTPICGTVQQRLSCGLYEFKDSKGRSPVSYLKILEKLSISVEQAQETGKMIDAEHFAEIVKVSKVHRGRPKKQSATIVAEHVNDLFTQLTPDAEEEIVMEIAEAPKKVTKKVISEEEKEAKKAALEKEREAKRQEREAQRAAEKEQKRQEKEAKLAQEKAEKEAKLAKEKAEKEAKLAEEKAEKEQKRQQEKEEKEAKKAAKGATKKVKEVTAEPVAKATPVPTPAPTKVTVSRITIDGVEYLKSATNILYDTKTKEEVGLYDPITKTIQELPEEEEEEVESDYEEEN